MRAAALNVGGASAVDIARWSPAYQSLCQPGAGLAHAPAAESGQRSTRITCCPDSRCTTITVPGALAIQNVFETLEWLSNSGRSHGLRAASEGLAAVGHGGAAGADAVRARRHDRHQPGQQHADPRGRLAEQHLGIPSRPGACTGSGPAPGSASLPGALREPEWQSIQLPGLDGLSISLDAQQQIGGFLAADGQTIPDPNQLSKLIFGISVFQAPGTLPFDFGY